MYYKQKQQQDYHEEPLSRHTKNKQTLELCFIDALFTFSKYKYHLHINNTIDWDTDLYLLQFLTNPPYSCSRSPTEAHTFRQRIKTHDEFDIPICREY